MNVENKKQFLTLILAIALGLVAAFLAAQFINNNVTQKTVEISTQLEKKMQDQSAALVQEMEKRDRELNKKVAELVREQQTIIQKPTVEGQAASVFSLKTPPGKRAFTVMIDSLSAVGGLINPGDTVDIIGHLNVPDQKNPQGQTEKIISVIFQNVQILAVGTSFTPTQTTSQYEAQQQARSLNVTLALEPEEAALLAFSQSNGKLQMILRSPDEKETQVLQIASWDTLADYVLQRQ